MNAADIMTRDIVAVAPETSLEQAIQLMTTHRISGLPVVGQSGQLVGMITEGDMLRRVETGTEGKPSGWLASFLMPGREAASYVLTHGRRVADIMTPSVMTVEEDTPLPDLVDLMQHNRIRRVPVVRDGRLIGIVSRADLVRRLGEVLSSASAQTDDGAIHRAIIETMEQQRWAPGRLISVAVRDGMVQLDGCLFDIREREALTVLAANVPGVKSVENRIVCVDPNTGMVTYDPAA
jgi:CBS domain-containing protein